MRTCPKCGTKFSRTERLCPHDGSLLEEQVPAEEQLIGKTLAGKYRIDGLLKRGGMGSVFRATHVMLDKPIAVKLIKPELVTSEDTVRRFQREARAASRLSHPNIVAVYDLGQTEDGTLYIAMELVEGQTLKDIVKRHGPLDPDRAVRVATAVASALGLIHKNHIVHRDLKSQNIMICQNNDGQEMPKLLDFGIAKTLQGESPALTSTGMVLGTPHYMSPEQASGKPVDKRTDLYALGIILYEMLAGKVPFDDASIPAILIKHMNEPPKPPSQIRPGLPPFLEQVVLQCLEKDPDKRYQSAEELSLALSGGAPTLVVAEMGRTLGLTALQPSSQSQQPPPAPASRVAASIRSVQERAPFTTPLAEPTTRVGSASASQRTSRSHLALALAVAVVALAGVWLAASSGLLGRWIGGASGGPRGLSSEGTPPPSPIPSKPPEGGATATVSLPAGGIESTPEAEPVSERRPGKPAAESRPQPPPPPTEQPETSAAAPLGRSPSEPELPLQPAVHLLCQGIPDACAAVNHAFQRAFGAAALPMTGPNGAHIELVVSAEEVEARTEEQFGTTFVVRTYTIAVTGEASRFGEAVPMPPPETVSFDARFGAGKLQERSRLLADAVTEEVLAYWSRKRQ